MRDMSNNVEAEFKIQINGHNSELVFLGQPSRAKVWSFLWKKDQLRK